MAVFELCASLLVVCALFRSSGADIPAPVHFYPYGCPQDGVMHTNDDESSVPITLKCPMRFYQKPYNRLFVNTNGLISFLNPISQYTPQWFPQSNCRLIAPYWADVDTRQNDGRIYCRESRTPGILQRAHDDILDAFEVSFMPRSVFIASWHRVTYFGGSEVTPVSTFQAVLMTDGRRTYVMFNYGDMAWTTGTASSGDCNGLGGVPAEVGFNAGDGWRYYTQFGSLTPDIINIRMDTNCGLRGRYMFRVDCREVLLPMPKPYGGFTPVYSRAALRRGKPKRG